MGKDKGQKKSPNRFEVGTHGGCEASLFEFTEKQSLEPRVVRIAALKIDEALAYLRWHATDFVIESVHATQGDAMNNKIKRPDYDDDFDSPKRSRK